MTYFEMRQAVQQAKDTIRTADDAATSLAIVLDGRLRSVNSPNLLRRLKKQLEAFNMTTGEWKK